MAAVALVLYCSPQKKLMKSQKNIINIIVLIRTSGDEVGVALPVCCTGKEIIEQLIEQKFILKKNDQGNDRIYELHRKSDRSKIPLCKSMLELEMGPNEVLELSEKLIPWGESPKIEITDVDFTFFISESDLAQNNLFIAVRFLPSGKTIGIKLSKDTLVEKIFNVIFEVELVKRFDPEGNPYIYEFIGKRLNTKLEVSDSFEEIDVEDGDLFYFLPRLIAGFRGSMIYEIPSLIQIGKKGTCKVSILKDSMKAFLFREGFGPEAKINEIDINDLMTVELEENSIQQPYLMIKNLNTSEQVITDDLYSSWNFDLVPLRIGFTSVILRISVIYLLERFGERKKNVFVIDHEIGINKMGSENDLQMIGGFDEISEWDDNFKKQLYRYIAKNETGLVLSKLANFFQKVDIDLFNEIILFQSRWNQGRSNNLLNIISTNEWMMIQTKINYGLLELIKNIDHGEISNRINLKTINKMKKQLKLIG